MTTEGSTWENPLMPNARLRQIYLAMMQARTLARGIPARRGQRSMLGLEACLVSPTVDLGANDLISDVLGGNALEFLRGKPLAEKKKRGLTAECGKAAALPPSTKSIERIWTAIGAAAALQSLATRRTAPDGATIPAAVVVAYMLPNEVPSAFLKKVLKLVADQRLPIIFVILPAAGTHKINRVSDLALSCHVPAIPTEASDAVAIYRVTQESIGHARIGGGPAVVECIPFVLPGKRRAASDAIAGLAQYMLPRKVVTQAWLDRETKAFARRVASSISKH